MLVHSVLLTLLLFVAVAIPAAATRLFLPGTSHGVTTWVVASWEVPGRNGHRSQFALRRLSSCEAHTFEKILVFMDIPLVDPCA